MSEDKVPITKRVYFDLPFVIFVRDNFRDLEYETWFEAVKRGDENPPYSQYAPKLNAPRNRVIGGGSPVYIPRELSEPYDIVIGNAPLKLGFLRRVNINSPTAVTGEVIGDRTGKASFSSVLATFDMKTVPPDFYWQQEMFAGIAVHAANHFIDHYRVLTEPKRFYVRPVSMTVIQRFLIFTDFIDGTFHRFEYHTGSSGGMFGFGGAIDAKIDEKLRRVVASEEVPLIYETLEVNILDHIDLGEWRLSIIESAILFEAWLGNFIRMRFSNNGLTSAEIDQKFNKPNSTEPRSIDSIARKLLDEATGFNFESTDEYKNWKTSVKNMRNELVHGKRFNVSQSEAYAAYAAVKKAIALLETK